MSWKLEQQTKLHLNRTMLFKSGTWYTQCTPRMSSFNKKKCELHFQINQNLTVLHTHNSSKWMLIFAWNFSDITEHLEQ